MIAGAHVAGPAAAQTGPLLDASDLPTGYRIGEGSPLTRTNVAASAPTITGCTWGRSTRVSGPYPVITSAGFSRTAGVGAQETVWQFEDRTPAKAFYARLAKTYRAATKCNPLLETDSAPGNPQPIDAGRFTRLRLGDFADASFAVTLLPPTRATPPSMVAFFRTGASVGTLTVTDPEIDPTAFAALASTAAARAT